MRKLSLIFLTLLTVFTLAACSNDETGENVVYVTAYPVHYLVEEIGKGIVDVKYVPGSHVHGESFDWSAQEIISMQDADLLFHVGGGLDNYIDANLNSIFRDQHVNLVKFSETINLINVCLVHDHDHDDHDHDYDEHDHDHDDHDHDNHDHDDECEGAENLPDPHFWLDVNRMIEAAELVKMTLLETYPEETTRIENNYVVVNALLNKLNSDYKEALHDNHKPVITNVKLFTYFERAYHVHIHPLTLNAHAHEDESVPTNLIEFVNLAIDNDINYILFEKNASSPAGETLLSEIRKSNSDIDKVFLHPLGNLTSEEVAQNKNYVNIMYDNLNALKSALE